MHYTPAQTRWFLDAIDRAERASRADEVMAARVAQADVKDVRAYLTTLRRKA